MLRVWDRPVRTTSTPAWRHAARAAVSASPLQCSVSAAVSVPVGSNDTSSSPRQKTYEPQAAGMPRAKLGAQSGGVAGHRRPGGDAVTGQVGEGEQQSVAVAELHAGDLLARADQARSGCGVRRR